MTRPARVALVLCVAACTAPGPVPRGAAVPAPAPAAPRKPVAVAPEPRPFALLSRFGERLLRHPAPVRSVAISADGKTLATTTQTESVVRLWDAATGRLVREVRVAGAGALSVGGFSADARRLLAVRQLDTSEQPRFSEHEWGILDAEAGAFHALGRLPKEFAPPVVSPDGALIGAVGERGELTVRSFDPAAPPRVLGAVHSGRLPGPNRVAFAPDGGQIVACGGWMLQVAPTDGSRPLRAFSGANYTSVFWPRPDRIVATHEATMETFDPVTGRALARTARGEPFWQSNRVAAGGVLFGSGYDVYGIIAVDPDTLAPVPGRTPVTPSGYVFAASADGKVLAVADRHAVRLFDAATAAPLLPDLDRLPTEPADRFEFSADGTRMLTSGGGTVGVSDLPNGRTLWSAKAGASGPMAGPMRTALSSDGRWVLTSSGFSMRTVVRDAETGRVRSDERWSKNKLLAGFDGPRRVWARNHTTGDLDAHELPNGPVVRTIAAPAKYTSFFASPDGRSVVARTAEAVLLRDARADDEWVEIESQRDVPRSFCGNSAPAGTIPLRFSPRGRYLLTWRRGLHLWPVTEKPARGVRLTAVPDDTWHWPDGSFSSDGRRVAAVVTETGAPGQVRVWETASGAEALRFDPPGGATGCALTPDGRLVVAHPDTTFSVWDYRKLEARAVGAVADPWEQLAGRDARAALAAVHALATDPTAVDFLRDRFRPADEAAVARLIAELSDDDYPTREAAERSLAALGERAEAALHRAATMSESAEVRGRAARLLGPLTGVHGAARLRAARAVEALERLGTPAAVALLTEWAKSGPPRLAAEAGSAADRLDRACTRRADPEQ